MNLPEAIDIAQRMIARKEILGQAPRLSGNSRAVGREHLREAAALRTLLAAQGTNA